MVSIRNEIIGIIQRFKELFPSLGTMSPDSTNTTVVSGDFNPEESPFVVFSGETRPVFVYGVSEFGGQDVVLRKDNISRSNKRYFSKIG